MSIASEITRLQGVKADILTAIGNKGVTVPADSALDDCPGLIADIPTGSNDEGYIVVDNIVYPYVTYTDSLFGKKVKMITKNLQMNVAGKCEFVSGEEWRGAYYFPQAEADIDLWCQNNGLTGWHCPTYSEGNWLFSTSSKTLNGLYCANSSVTNATILPYISSSKDWSALGAGTSQYRDLLGLGFEPLGALYGGNSWHGDVEFCCWAAGYLFSITPTSIGSSSFGEQTYISAPIRLIKLEDL